MVKGSDTAVCHADRGLTFWVVQVVLIDVVAVDGGGEYG